MQVIDSPELDPNGTQTQADDPLVRFRSWRGFFFATFAVNLLFVYGMLGGMSNASLSIWYKTLIWLPFNVIATAIYLAIMARLGNAGWAFYRILGAIMIVANWSVMLAT